jgi:hypothetical protein
MIFRNRAMKRAGAGAAGLLAVGAFAAPALADDSADLAVKLTGTTIAADASGKFTGVSLINNSKVPASGILLSIDISQLDTDKVQLRDEDCDPVDNGVIRCGIVGDTIEAGADIDWFFPLEKRSEATGSAGTITVTISHAGSDPDESNNSVTAEVVLSDERGVDLVVVAEDIRDAIDLADSVDSPAYNGEQIYPGDASALVLFVGNQGDLIADGLKVSAKLPEHVTFAEAEEGCDYSAANDEITCVYEGMSLIPSDRDDDGSRSGAYIWFPVQVAADVTGPITLPNGSVRVDAVRAVAELPEMKAQQLPGNVRPLTAQELRDIDETDNVDDFSVYVLGTGGGGGGLPVTGAQAGLIGGIGAAVVVIGGVLFLTARRRVVLVTPGDGK